MSAREVRLTLSEAEAEHLAGMGVVADPHGFLRSADGSEVAAGTAAQMLSKARDSASGRFAPSDYVRGGQLRQVGRSGGLPLCFTGQEGGQVLPARSLSRCLGVGQFAQRGDHPLPGTLRRAISFAQAPVAVADSPRRFVFAP